ncbi:MAG: Hint domain-containing protein [Pseudomonadota bacterium]
MAIGEAGSITRGGFGDTEVVRIDFEEPLENAVVHLTSTNAGGNEFSLRIVEIDETGFSFIVEEWEDEDGPHPAGERINWLAIEEGVHTLADGRVIEAGFTTAGTTPSSVALNGDFTDPPAVLTNAVVPVVPGDPIPDVVDSDPLNITADGFDVQIQEGSLADGVNTGETVGYIAIGVGGDGTSGFTTVQDGLNSGNTVFDLGGTLSNGVVLAETQTINETDAGNVVLNDIPAANGSTGDINLRFDEETGDGEAAHGNETVAIVGFEDGLILCLTTGTLVETTDGPRLIEELHEGDTLLSIDGSDPRLLRVYSRVVDAEEMEANPKLYPVRIVAGALGAGLPKRDLLVSRQHRILVNSPIAERMFGQPEVLVAAIRLTALPGIYVDTSVGEVEYVHLMLDAHHVIYAEGAPTESLFPGAEACKALPHAALKELSLLFPDLVDPERSPESARPIPSGAHQKQLVARHVKNGKPLLGNGMDHKARHPMSDR